VLNVIMSEQITKNQHYIPQSLLKHFSNDGKLFEVLTQDKKIFPTTVGKTMCENYTYEHDQLPTNTVENFFSRIEGVTSPAVEELINLIDDIKDDRKDIGEFKSRLSEILGYLLIYYYRSGALLTEFSSFKETEKVPLLSEKILNEDYISSLAQLILDFYSFAIIESDDDFLLSDQFISTAAFKAKAQFFDVSNRHIGLNEIIILIPISSSYYTIFWNTKTSFFVEPNKINVLNEEQVKQINSSIINNSYTKCIAKKIESIEGVIDEYRWSSPTQVFAGGNPDNFHMGAINKKEVFFTTEERDAYDMFTNAFFTQYKDLKRNDTCACNSGKKFKKCHESTYKRCQSIALFMQKSQRQVMRDSAVYGVPFIEQPIDKWSGFSEKSES
tara:strand:+ start:1278 stop:2435 length:1158 start_codon:yes stop_codon:yes gene_type:complete